MTKIRTVRRETKPHWWFVIDHEGTSYLVPWRIGGWAERRPLDENETMVDGGECVGKEAEKQLFWVGYQPRSGEAARSGPSGAPVPDEQRKRPAVKLTLDPALLAQVDALVEQGAFTSRSAAIEQAIHALFAFRKFEEMGRLIAEDAPAKRQRRR